MMGANCKCCHRNSELEPNPDFFVEERGFCGNLIILMTCTDCYNWLALHIRSTAEYTEWCLASERNEAQGVIVSCGKRKPKWDDVERKMNLRLRYEAALQDVMIRFHEMVKERRLELGDDFHGDTSVQPSNN